MKFVDLIIVNLVLATVGSAAPIGVNLLDKMADSASLIVVARVASGIQQGSTASLVLDVLRALKGTVPAGGMLSAEVQMAAEFSTSSRSLVGIQGIWFLMDAGMGKLKVLPVMTGSVPLEWMILPAAADLPESWRAPAGASALERVVREMAAATEKAGKIKTPAPILSQLAATANPSLRGVYQQMASSQVSTLGVLGIAGLLRSNHAAALQSLRQKASASKSVDGSSWNMLVDAVCAYSDANVSGLAVLAEPASAPQSVPGLQECAASALRMIHSRETVPFLVNLLDNSNLSIRYEGVAGLASYANSGHIPNEKPYTVDGILQQRQPSPLHSDETENNFPTAETFQKDQLRYITFWKQWAMR